MGTSADRRESSARSARAPGRDGSPSASTTAASDHNGRDLLEMFAAATSWLERNADAINSINVYPVPDGDTGTNMYLTMRATLEEAFHAKSDAAGTVAQAMARGALMGARGNSGVILSQILSGIADRLSEKESFSGSDFAEALEAASQKAYKAVSQPVEGTILTVMREGAAAAKRKARRMRSSLKSVLASTVEAAREAVSKTPSLLPVLREAGVVDAGGQGLYIMLEGALRYIRGDTGPPVALTARDPEASWLAATASLHEGAHPPYGYCTEFLVRGKNLDSSAILEKMLTLGDSVLVVGDESLLRVHVHTQDPGAALTCGTALGSVTTVKVDNIRTQAEEFVTRPRPEGEGPAARVSTVAVVEGLGLEQVLSSLGVTAIVRGGQTMNPSTEEILAAAEACPSPEVIILPNNKNVVMAARQAAEHSTKTVKVVPTTSVPQGVAALLALNAEAGLEENATAMEEARQTVRTAEVTRAVRPALLGSLRVRRGQAIALIDGQLKVAEESLRGAVRASLGHMVTPSSSLITLYCGADTSREEAQALADDLAREYPSLEIELVAGGQPHYHYIVSVE
jgi:DAK2 domain fusion protein YloV